MEEEMSEEDEEAPALVPIKKKGKIIDAQKADEHEFSSSSSYTSSE